MAVVGALFGPGSGSTSSYDEYLIWKWGLGCETEALTLQSATATAVLEEQRIGGEMEKQLLAKMSWCPLV